MLGFYFSRISPNFTEKMLLRSKQCQPDVTPGLLQAVLKLPYPLRIILIKEPVQWRMNAHGTAPFANKQG